MSAQEYDCIVLGAGIEGSFSAYHLAKHGSKTLLLEQFLLPHSRGSSHGQTRIIRRAHVEDFYTHMMEESYSLWRQLEAEAGIQLHRQTGLLVVAPENHKSFQLVKDTVKRNQVPHVVLEPSEFSQHIPGFTLSQNHGALVDTSAGVLYADRALKAVQGLFKNLGGVIKDGQKVTDIQPGDVVTVTTPSGIYRAKSLVITAGPWANKVLAGVGLELPLQVQRINVCYWREKEPGTYSASSRFPCFIQIGAEEAEEIYGLPTNEYPGLMKVCIHGGSECDPDERDKQVDSGDIGILSRYVARCLPGLEPIPAVMESCMYTVTPDHNYILDRHPSHRNIIIGAGFSGHGFKLSPVVGKVLCELSLGQLPSYDLSPFKIQRFGSALKATLETRPTEFPADKI